jgi:UDP-2,3-diacylglucosamine pyrophosphatase LpxH
MRVVFSDLHFGDPACSLSSRKVSRGLRTFLDELGGVDEMILAGDILDANISSLTRAIEGSGRSRWPRHQGLRGWLSHILSAGFDPGRIVYVPGNHDYVIWNQLATQRAFIEPLARGRRLTGNPLMQATFAEPFIRGVAPPAYRKRFVVSYPDHEFDLSGRRVLVTHGHYLDRAQSLFKNLSRIIEEEGGNERRAVRRFFIMTAQYQAVAHAVSYMRSSRTLVDRVHKNVSRLFDLAGKLRDKPLSAGIVAAMEMYIKYFRRTRLPNVFVFGHTHRAGRARSTDFASRKERLYKRGFEIVNTGSFIRNEEAKTAGSFVVLSARRGLADAVTIYRVDTSGRVTRTG